MLLALEVTPPPASNSSQQQHHARGANRNSLEKLEGFHCESSGGEQILQVFLTDRRAARQGWNAGEVLEHEKCLDTKQILCFRTWKLVSRDVGEVQSGRRWEDVVEVFRSGFFETVEGRAREIPCQHLLLLARPSTRQLHHWMFGQHHSNHITMETLAIQMTHGCWGKSFIKRAREVCQLKPYNSKYCILKSICVVWPSWAWVASLIWMRAFSFLLKRIFTLWTSP